MAWEKDSGDDEKTIAYDLRQVYVKIVGEHMLHISYHRKAQEFYNWFKSLEDLYTVTCFKYDYDKDENAEDKYDELKKSIVDLSMKYPATWIGKIKIPQHVKEIDEKLRELEVWLYYKMEEAGIFGRGYIYDEDEI